MQVSVQFKSVHYLLVQIHMLALILTIHDRWQDQTFQRILTMKIGTW